MRSVLCLLTHFNCRSLLRKYYHFTILMKWMLWLFLKHGCMTLSQTWTFALVIMICLLFDELGFKNQIRCCIHQDFSESGSIDHESLWIALFSNTKKDVLLCCVYRSPSDYHFYDHFVYFLSTGPSTFCWLSIVDFILPCKFVRS